MKRSYFEFLIAGAVLAGFLLIFFSNVIFTGGVLAPAANIYEQPFYRPYAPAGFTGAPNTLLADQSLQFYPLQQFIMCALRQGRLLLWNPHILLGIPTAGNALSGVFYPWNLWAFHLSVPLVYLIRSFLNLWIAGLFTFLFVRRAGGGAAGAYLAATAFMFCGFLIVWLGHPQANAAVWLPALLYFTEMFITSRHFRGMYAGLCAAVTGMVFLAGHMETAFEVCLAWLLFYLIRCVQIRGARAIRHDALWALCIPALGMMLAAVQILPFLEWLAASAEMTKRSSCGFSLYDWHHLKQLPAMAALIIPNICINPSQVNIPNINLVPWGNFNEIAAYIGIIPIFIGIWGLRLGRKENRMIFLCAAGGVFFLFLAFRLPVFDWINQLPVFSMFALRRYRLIFDFGMSAAAGLALDIWVSGLERADAWRKTAFFLFLSGIMIFACIFVTGFALRFFREPILEYGRGFITHQYMASAVHSRPLEKVLSDADRIVYVLTRYFSADNWRLYFPGLVACACALLIAAWKRKAIGAGTFKYGLVCLTLCDLCVFGIGYNPVVKPEYIYPETPAVEFLKNDTSIFRILPVRMEWVSNGPLMHGLSEMGGADLPTKYYKGFTDAIPGKDGLGFMFFSAQSAHSKLIDLLNVKYIVTTGELAVSAGRDMALRWQKDGIRIYENKNVMPRAFIVHKVRILSDDDLLRALRDPAFKPSTEVLLGGTIQISLESALGAEEIVSLENYEPENIRIRTRTTADGMLVLSDAYYPGWRAYLDNRQARIHRANYVMRAVELPKGIHEVEFRYTPFSLYLGAALSVCAGAVVCAMIGMLALRSAGKNRVV